MDRLSTNQTVNLRLPKNNPSKINKVVKIVAP